jgi:hypothetical protein
MPGCGTAAAHDQPTSFLSRCGTANSLASVIAGRTCCTAPNPPERHMGSSGRTTRLTARHGGPAFADSRTHRREARLRGCRSSNPGESDMKRLAGFIILRNAKPISYHSRAAADQGFEKPDAVLVRKRAASHDTWMLQRAEGVSRTGCPSRHARPLFLGGRTDCTAAWRGLTGYSDETQHSPRSIRSQLIPPRPPPAPIRKTEEAPKTSARPRW